MNTPSYYISRSHDEQGYVLLEGFLLFDNRYSNDILQDKARLYAVFDTLENQTNSTSNFVLYHDNGECIQLEWTDTHEAEARDISPITIPLTFVRQTTNPQNAEITHIEMITSQQFNNIEHLVQIAIEELSNINPTFKVQKRIANLVINDAIQQELSCGITMNPFTHEMAACVAPCYHVFDKEAITTWLKTKDTCPECREKCSI